MGKKAGEREANQAVRTNLELMHNFSGTGVPIFNQGLAAVRGRLAEGEPGYVANAYRSAGTSAAEMVGEAQTAGRSRVLEGKSGGARLGAMASIYAGGSAALSQERAGIALARASSKISDRESLVGMLAGAGFQATDLAAGFGGLTNRSLSVASQGGNPLFESIVGGTAAGSQLFLSALAKPGTPALSAIPTAAGATPTTNMVWPQ